MKVLWSPRPVALLQWPTSSMLRVLDIDLDRRTKEGTRHERLLSNATSNCGRQSIPGGTGKEALTDFNSPQTDLCPDSMSRHVICPGRRQRSSTLISFRVGSGKIAYSSNTRPSTESYVSTDRGLLMRSALCKKAITSDKQ